MLIVVMMLACARSECQCPASALTTCDDAAYMCGDTLPYGAGRTCAVATAASLRHRNTKAPPLDLLCHARRASRHWTEGRLVSRLGRLQCGG